MTRKNMKIYRIAKDFVEQTSGIERELDDMKRNLHRTYLFFF
ncbi:MAG: hypothetical protein ACTSWC_01935 [Promethearchaeota archaeon]